MTVPSLPAVAKLRRTSSCRLRFIWLLFPLVFSSCSWFDPAPEAAPEDERISWELAAETADVRYAGVFEAALTDEAGSVIGAAFYGLSEGGTEVRLSANGGASWVPFPAGMLPPHVEDGITAMGASVIVGPQGTITGIGFGEGPCVFDGVSGCSAVQWGDLSALSPAPDLHAVAALGPMGFGIVGDQDAFLVLDFGTMSWVQLGTTPSGPVPARPPVSGVDWQDIARVPGAVVVVGSDASVYAFRDGETQWRDVVAEELSGVASDVMFRGVVAETEASFVLVGDDGHAWRCETTAPDWACDRATLPGGSSVDLYAATSNETMVVLVGDQGKAFSVPVGTDWAAAQGQWVERTVQHSLGPVTLVDVASTGLEYITVGFAESTSGDVTGVLFQGTVDPTDECVAWLETDVDPWSSVDPLARPDECGPSGGSGGDTGGGDTGPLDTGLHDWTVTIDLATDCPLDGVDGLAEVGAFLLPGSGVASIESDSGLGAPAPRLLFGTDDSPFGGQQFYLSWLGSAGDGAQARVTILDRSVQGTFCGLHDGDLVPCRNAPDPVAFPGFDFGYPTGVVDVFTGLPNGSIPTDAGALHWVQSISKFRGLPDADQRIYLDDEERRSEGMERAGYSMSHSFVIGSTAAAFPGSGMSPSDPGATLLPVHAPVSGEIRLSDPVSEPGYGPHRVVLFGDADGSPEPADGLDHGADDGLVFELVGLEAACLQRGGAAPHWVEAGEVIGWIPVPDPGATLRFDVAVWVNDRVVAHPDGSGGVSHVLSNHWRLESYLDLLGDHQFRSYERWGLTPRSVDAESCQGTSPGGDTDDPGDTDDSGDTGAPAGGSGSGSPSACQLTGCEASIPALDRLAYPLDEQGNYTADTPDIAFFEVAPRRCSDMVHFGGLHADLRVRVDGDDIHMAFEDVRVVENGTVNTDPMAIRRVRFGTDLPDGPSDPPAGWLHKSDLELGGSLLPCPGGNPYPSDVLMSWPASQGAPLPVGHFVEPNLFGTNTRTVRASLMDVACRTLEVELQVRTPGRLEMLIPWSDIVGQSVEVPPGPATSPPPSLTVPPDPITGDLGDDASFLWTGVGGAPATQTVPDPSVFSGESVGVAFGHVQDLQGDALAGALVQVADHPEFGTTLSRSDGRFDLALLGGHTYELQFSLAGHASATRHVTVPRNGFGAAERVALVPLSAPMVFDVDDVYGSIPANGLLHEGTAETAPRGCIAGFGPCTGIERLRQPRLFASGGTVALVDGVRQMSDWSIRLTEYTVGPNGRAAMPGELPPGIAYTYAFEATLDGASAGATVEFVQAGDESISSPLFVYYENFIGAPTGTAVPLGVLDDERGVWEPELDGHYIELLPPAPGRSEAGVRLGREIDGTPAATLYWHQDQAALESIQLASTDKPWLTFTRKELQRLAESYSAELAALTGSQGYGIARVPLAHFTPFDPNHPGSRPPRGGGSDAPEDDPQDPRPVQDEWQEDVAEPLDPDPCETGSEIRCLDAEVTEHIALPGTHAVLEHRSDDARGQGRENAVEIPLVRSDGTVNPLLYGVEITIEIAGQIHNYYFTRDEVVEQRTLVFEWDGLDGYGRRVDSPRKARIGHDKVLYSSYLVIGGQSGRSFGLTSESEPGGDPDTFIMPDHPDGPLTMIRKSSQVWLTHPRPDLKSDFGGWNVSGVVEFLPGLNSLAGERGRTVPAFMTKLESAELGYQSVERLDVTWHLEPGVGVGPLVPAIKEPSALFELDDGVFAMTREFVPNHLITGFSNPAVTPIRFDADIQGDIIARTAGSGSPSSPYECDQQWSSFGVLKGCEVDVRVTDLAVDRNDGREEGFGPVSALALDRWDRVWVATSDRILRYLIDRNPGAAPSAIDRPSEAIVEEIARVGNWGFGRYPQGYPIDYGYSPDATDDVFCGSGTLAEPCFAGVRDLEVGPAGGLYVVDQPGRLHYLHPDGTLDRDIVGEALSAIIPGVTSDPWPAAQIADVDVAEDGKVVLGLQYFGSGFREDHERVETDQGGIGSGASNDRLSPVGVVALFERGRLQVVGGSFVEALDPGEVSDLCVDGAPADGLDVHPGSLVFDLRGANEYLMTSPLAEGPLGGLARVSVKPLSVGFGAGDDLLVSLPDPCNTTSGLDGDYVVYRITRDVYGGEQGPIADNVILPSEDGELAYLFSKGRHAATWPVATLDLSATEIRDRGTAIVEYLYADDPVDVKDGACVGATGDGLCAIRDIDGRTTEFLRDADGRVHQIVGPEGITYDLDFATNGMLSQVTGPTVASGQPTWTISYTDRGERLGLIDHFQAPGGPVASFCYDEAGSLVGEIKSATPMPCPADETGWDALGGTHWFKHLVVEPATFFIRLDGSSWMERGHPGYVPGIDEVRVEGKEVRVRTSDSVARALDFPGVAEDYEYILRSGRGRGVGFVLQRETPDGRVQTTRVSKGGGWRVEGPDGSVLTTTMGAHPLWGWSRPTLTSTRTILDVPSEVLAAGGTAGPRVLESFSSLEWDETANLWTTRLRVDRDGVSHESVSTFQRTPTGFQATSTDRFGRVYSTSLSPTLAVTAMSMPDRQDQAIDDLIVEYRSDGAVETAYRAASTSTSPLTDASVSSAVETTYAGAAPDSRPVLDVDRTGPVSAKTAYDALRRMVALSPFPVGGAPTLRDDSATTCPAGELCWGLDAGGRVQWLTTESGNTWSYEYGALGHPSGISAPEGEAGDASAARWTERDLTPMGRLMQTRVEHSSDETQLALPTTARSGTEAARVGQAYDSRGRLTSQEWLASGVTTGELHFCYSDDLGDRPDDVVAMMDTDAACPGTPGTLPAGAAGLAMQKAGGVDHGLLERVRAPDGGTAATAQHEWEFDDQLRVETASFHLVDALGSPMAPTVTLAHEWEEYGDLKQIGPLELTTNLTTAWDPVAKTFPPHAHARSLSSIAFDGMHAELVFGDYDSLERPTTKSLVDAGGATLFDEERAWQEEELAWVQSDRAVVGGLDQVRRHFAYDDQRRLSEVYDEDVSVLPGVAVGPVECFTYDEGGNRLTVAHGDPLVADPCATAVVVETAEYGTRDRLMARSRCVGSPATTLVDFFEYTVFDQLASRRTYELGAGCDADAHALGEPTGSPDESAAFDWDPRGRLNSVVLSDGRSVDYAYDVLGRLVGRTEYASGVEVATEGFVYGGENRPVARVDELGRIDASYVYAPGLLAPAVVQTYDSSGVVLDAYVLAADSLGSVRAVVSTDGALAAASRVLGVAEYDAWGVRNQLGAFPSAVQTGGLQPGFAGGWEDPVVGLVRMGSRWYSPELGRWVSTDPAGLAGGTNLFEYVGGAPNAFVDPDGHERYSPLDLMASLQRMLIACDEFSWAGDLTEFFDCIWDGGCVKDCPVPDAEFSMDSAKCAAGLALFSRVLRGVDDVFDLRVAREALDRATGCKKCPCFVPGTLVLMADGSTKPIEDVEPGEWVWAVNPVDDGEGGGRPSLVVHRSKNFTERVVRIEISSKGGHSAIEATGEHPFWVLGSGWVAADSVVSGDRFLSSDGTPVDVLRVEEERRVSETYNLTVADVETYFVVAGGQSVLVHNRDIDLGDGFTGRVDHFETRGQSGFEIHVFDRTGREVGVHGPTDWISKHGHSGSAPDLPDSVWNRLNGRLVQENRARGWLPPKGTADITDGKWKDMVRDACP